MIDKERKKSDQVNGRSSNHNVTHATTTAIRYVRHGMIG